MTSYLCENQAENLQSVDVHLAQIPGLFVELKQAITFQIRQILREEKSVPE